MSQLSGTERLAERQQSLDLISSRYGLAPIKPKTFWEVAETVSPGLCTGPSDPTR
jgi:hypothetical protein